MSVRILFLLRDRSVVFFTLHGSEFFNIVEGWIRSQRGYWGKVTWFVPLELSDRIESRIGVCGEKQEGIGVSASASAQRMEVLWRLAEG